MSLLKLDKFEVSISGMTCSNCSNFLESSLKKLDFIKSANVNLVTEKALIVLDTDKLLINKQENFNSEQNNNKHLNYDLEKNLSFNLNPEKIIQSAIEKIGFTVNNISKINEKENSLTRYLNLIFQKVYIENQNYPFNYNSDYNVSKFSRIKRLLCCCRKYKNNKSKSLNNNIEAIELGNSINTNDSKEISTESVLKSDENKNFEHDIHYSHKKKRKVKSKNKKPEIFEEETEKLLNHELDFIINITGVLNINLINNAYYRIEYDISLVKGHELFNILQQNFYKNIIQNYVHKEADRINSNMLSNNCDLANYSFEKLRNAYKITYVNEFNKNTREIYSFVPTTNLKNLIIVIMLLIAILCFSMIFKNFEFAYQMRRIFIFGNIDLYLILGLLFSFIMILAYGLKIYRKALLSFFRLKLVNMETLIALGSGSSIILTFINIIKLLQENQMHLIEVLNQNYNYGQKLDESGMHDSENISSTAFSNMKSSNATNNCQMDLSEMTIHSAEAAAAVIAIFIIGKYLEEKAKNEIKKLTINMFSDEKLFLKNKTKYVKPTNKDFSKFLQEKNIDVGLVEKDDFCKVQKNDFLLFDCVIIKGSLEVNENSNYGIENIIKRGVGDKLKSGTQIYKLLEDDAIVIVTEVIEQSVLFKVIKEISASLNQKLKFQHFIDKIIKWFVPIIIFISITTFIIWFLIKIILVDFNRKFESDTNYQNKMGYLTMVFVFERAISILVVSCPCAFGLAIPIVTTISINKSLQNGILVKNVGILPEIRKANAFVFDKTGTMTLVRRDVKIEYLDRHMGIYNYDYLGNQICWTYDKEQILNDNQDCCNSNKPRIKENIEHRVILKNPTGNNDNPDSVYETKKDIIYEMNEPIETNKNIVEARNELIKHISSSDENTYTNLKNESLEGEWKEFPLYDAIAAIEKNQKQPIGEIMYSFAIKRIQGLIDNERRNNYLNNENFIPEKFDNGIDSAKNLHEGKESFNSSESESKNTHNQKINNIYLIQESCEVFSCGIRSDLIWKTSSGTEIQGKVNNNCHKFKFLIGNRKFIEDINFIPIPDSIKKSYRNLLMDSTATIIFTCLNQTILGIFSIDSSSIIRPELDFVISSLRAQKEANEIFILSGDNKNSVDAVAKKLNIHPYNCISGVSSSEKKSFLLDLKNKNKNVLMIGDGLNDILGISEANYGISFNANSQFNLVASDIIFMKEDLNLILLLLRISKVTYTFIWINIFWAFIYNIIMIPITAGVFYSFWDYLMSPTVSSFSMLCSSLLIIVTSNLLRYFI